MNNLKKTWKDYKENNLETVYMSDFAYAEQQKEKIQEALCYWQFLKDQSWMQSSKIEDQKVFEDFVLSHCENQYMKIVSIMFLLPSKVWRKILWRYNIDFLSHETFLRRLQEDQITAIYEKVLA